MPSASQARNLNHCVNDIGESNMYAWLKKSNPTLRLGGYKPPTSPLLPNPNDCVNDENAELYECANREVSDM